MASILFHIISGPNNTSKAMLGFLLARTAVEEGHKVEVFFLVMGFNWLEMQ